MKQIAVLFILITTLLNNNVYSQGISFSLGNNLIDNISKVTNSALDFADIDNDGDLDLFISGSHDYGNGSSAPLSKLYINDGLGNYTVDNTSFTNYINGSVNFADFDNDNDQDLLLTGNGTTTLYGNNINGSYNQYYESKYFITLNNSSASVADINNNGYKDFIIAGYEGTHLYKNNGNMNFTIVNGTNFPKASNGSVDFADFNGDNYMDIIITGSNSGTASTKLFLNNGDGSFTENTNTPFDGVANSDVAIADIDGDNDIDIVISGSSNTGKICKMYKNDGNGNFTYVSNTPFLTVDYSNLKFTDIDNDNDMDLILTGRIPSELSGITKLYINNGSGVFTEDLNNIFHKILQGCIGVADINGDNLKDIILTGRCDVNNTSNIYINNSSGEFNEVGDNMLKQIISGDADFADIDSDNDLDILITGNTDLNNYNTLLYKNNGNGNFVEVNQNTFSDFANNGTVNFADIDNDGDQDVLLTGSTNAYYSSELYKNDGYGNFTLVPTPFINVNNSSVQFADFNNDGFKDVIIAGSTNNGKKTQLYFNDGSGGFYGVTSPFFGIYAGSISVADVDGDNDIDVLVSGGNNTKLYININNGHFSCQDENISNFSQFSDNHSDFADIDNDGDYDLIIIGSSMPIEKYINNGFGKFTKTTDNDLLPNVTNGSFSLNDIDNDGDPDLLISGKLYNDYISTIYSNDGNGHFTTVSSTNIMGIQGKGVFGDINGDSKDDLLIFGQANNLVRYTKIYTNTTTVGIKEYNNNEIKAYPNPTQENVIIEYTEKFKNSTIYLINSLGQVIFTDKTNNSLRKIIILGNTKGLYFIKIVSNKGETQTIKIIRE